MLDAIIWNVSTIFLAAFIIFSFFLFLYMGLKWGNLIDKYFDEPPINLPDEITVEIVKDNSDQPEVSQPEPFSEASKASEHNSSVS